MHSGHKNEEHNHTTATRTGNRKRLTLVLVLVTVYMIAEGLGGWWTNSLALLADAGHMLSDVAALALSLFAMWMAQKPATQQRTYGYYRAEILAALANAATLRRCSPSVSLPGPDSQRSAPPAGLSAVQPATSAPPLSRRLSASRPGWPPAPCAPVSRCARARRRRSMPCRSSPTESP